MSTVFLLVCIIILARISITLWKRDYKQVKAEEELGKSEVDQTWPEKELARLRALDENLKY